MFYQVQFIDDMEIYPISRLMEAVSADHLMANIAEEIIELDKFYSAACLNFMLSKIEPC